MSPKLGIICFDAGGANQLAAFVRNNPGDYIYCLDGPAVSIFQRELGPVETLDTNNLVEKSDVLISGTGWASQFEWIGMKTMKEAGKKVIALIDHWSNYEERFVRNGMRIYPDEIWVTDSEAESLAKKTFSEIKIVKVENFYVQEIRTRRTKSYYANQGTPSKETLRILYLCEPIREIEAAFGKALGIDEFQAIEQLEKMLGDSTEKGYEVLIRPHPSENKGKYLEISNRTNFKISSNVDLSLDLIWANCVVGIDSYAMYVADQIGIETFTVLSSDKSSMSIPKGNIKPLDALPLRNEPRTY